MAFNNENFPKVLNEPGSSGGETNGLYASVTENDFYPVDMSYLDDNTPSVFDFNAIGGAVAGAVGLVRDVKNAQTQSQLQQIKNDKVIAQAKLPTMAQEWAKLSIFEKLGFALAVFGVFYLVAHK